MIFLNLSRPLTGTQRVQLEALSSQPIEEIRDVPAHFDHAHPFPEQIRALVDAIGLTPEEWQNRPLLINPPAYNFAALTLLAELHGRMGYFPAIVRIRPAVGIDGHPITPPHCEVAEIINLQAVRDAAREKRV